jgi:DNA-binding transcriptional LysR family regulator
MDLQARPLQYFLAVARHKSFSRAAEWLNVSQPALSAQIRELERVLGFQLFERSSRHVALTREGRLFIRDARRMVAQSERLMRAADAIRCSELRLGTAIYTVLIPERVNLLTGFYARHPDTRVQVTNLFQVDQYAQLRQGELDLALSIGLSRAGMPAFDEADSEIVFPPDFERMVLSVREAGLRVPEGSPLAEAEEITLSDLAGHQIVMLGDLHGAELIDALSLPLLEAGAELVVPPEGNAIAVEQFGQATGLPAVALGWFEYGGVAGRLKALKGLDVHTELALLRLHAADHRAPAEAFWNYAKNRD